MTTPLESSYGTPKEIAQLITQDCIARRLQQVNRRVTRLYDDALRPVGVTANQLNILATLVSQGQLQPGQLGQVLGMEKSTVSRTISRMSDKGWLDIGPGKDGRSQTLKVTPKGRQLLIKAVPIWDQLQADVLGSMVGSSSILTTLGLAETPEITQEEFYSDDDFAADFYG